ncbi:MAG: hypothetical protein LBD75_00825 [Candidatus Peribacteria bacterium]|jgi:UDP-N-acetylmuramate--alanine ligase|nr:hypothetical protein [Candidatus Peribacteria bacterium]
MSKYFKTIAFAGTNGKSSSSAMGIFTAKEVLNNFGLGILGALVPDFGGKSYQFSDREKEDIYNIFQTIFTGKKLKYDLVKKYYFFVEACEYQRHFLTLDLDDAIITSLELEHTDYFNDREDYQSAFLELIEKIKGNVYVLPNLNSEKILKHPKTVIVEAQHFNFQYIWGDYQQQNASLVSGLLNHLTDRTQQQTIKKLIESFGGLRRRMEKLTTTEKGAIIFSDYGHLASSLEGGFQALQEKFPDKNLICIFQPHQIHRILQGRDRFPAALKGYDKSFIYKIYAAREHFQEIIKDSGKTLHNISNIDELGEIFAKHCQSSYLKTFEEVENIIEQADEKSIIIVYSAGDIDYQLRKYLKLVS